MPQIPGTDRGDGAIAHTFISERFVYRQKSEVDNNRDDILMLEDIKPTRDQWLSLYTIWDDVMGKLEYPAHMRDVLAAIKIAWDDFLQQKWEKEKNNDPKRFTCDRCSADRAQDDGDGAKLCARCFRIKWDYDGEWYN